MKGGANVAHALELIVHPRMAKGLLVRIERDGLRQLLRSFLERLKRALSRQHARLHRRVRTLDLRHIQHAGSVADEHTTGKCQLWNGLKATLANGARSILQALTALEHRRNERMVLGEK